jgi:hypothetical protein
VVVEGSDRLRDGAKAEASDPTSRTAVSEGGAEKSGKGGRRRKNGE